VERFVASALAEKLSGLARVQQMAEKGNREDFLAVLAKVPAAGPLPDDPLDETDPR
jgi:preprotein translocase subunit Sss1